MIIHYVAVIFLFSQLPLYGQQRDYLKIRDSLYHVTCGQVDSSDVFQSMRRLESLDTLRIKRNMDQYYIDLGTTYWLASNAQDNAYLQKSIRCDYKALYHNSRNTIAYWNLAIAYGILRECDKLKTCLYAYKYYLPKKLWTESDEQQEKTALQDCEE